MISIPRLFVFLAAAWTSAALAVDGTFVGAGNGSATTANYSDTTKWTGGTVASGTGATATINLSTATGAGNTTMTLTSAVTLGTFQLGSSNSGANFSLAGNGTAASSTITWAVSSGTPALRLDTYFSKGYGFGGGSLTFAGTQGLTINTGSNSFNPSGSGLSWSGFSGTLTITANNNDGGTCDPQTGGTLPTTHLTLTPVGSGSITLGMFAGRDQTIGGFDGAAATYVRNNATSFSTLTLGTGNDSGNFAGVFGKNVGAAATDFRSNINITKNGTGTQKFSGTNYSGGATTINAGKFLVNGTHTATITASGNLAATTGTGGKYAVNSGGTLGGTGTIKPFDTAGAGVMIDVKSGGVLAPGDPATSSGVGTLTFDQTASNQSVLNFSSGATATFDLATTGNDKVALVGKAGTTEVFFNSTVLNFNDLSNGGLGAGQYVLFQGDANTDYSGLTLSGTTITAGVSIGTGLGSYTGSTLKLIGTNIVLDLVVPPALPAAPTGLAVTGTYGGVALSWSAVGAATAYKVKRGTVSGGPYTTLASGVTATTFTDSSAIVGVTYYYVVSSVNANGEGANSAQVSASATAQGVSVNLKAASSSGLAASEVAGAAHLANWLNLTGPTGSGNVASLATMVDSTGAAVAGLSMSITGGTSGGSLNLATETGGDVSLFASVFDQYDGTPGTFTVSGVPYASYDVLVFMRGDTSDAANGATRAGSFTIGSTTYYVRGGVGAPATDGSGYVRSSDTTLGAGTDIDQGNYVRFTGLTSSSFTCSFVAVNAGNGARRLKVPGFQIIASTAPAAVTSAPATPANVTAIAGNNQVTLAWSTTNTATSYVIMRATSPGGTYASIATVSALNTSYIDTSAVNGTTYYYTIVAANGVGPSAASSPLNAAPYDAATVRAIGVDLMGESALGMAVYDQAGVIRVPNWNDLVSPATTSGANTLATLTDNTGAVISGASVTLSTSANFLGAYNLQPDGTTAYNNDGQLFNSVVDHDAGAPSSVTFSGIPYASYDVYVFVHDDGSTRAGKITVGGNALYVRGGLGDPASTGLGYVESTDTTLGTGADIQRGNYVRFAAQTGASCTVNFEAVNAGDTFKRIKVAGVQIVSNTTVPVVAPTAAPATPGGLVASGGNGQVGLSWSASATATSYKIRRGGALIATVVAPGSYGTVPTFYADYGGATALTNGATYSYTVSAANSVGESAESAAATATPAAPAFTLAPRSVFQWSVRVIPTFNPETADPERRAYLWIPPGTTLVRGLVVGLANMLEKPLFDDPNFRQACADAGLGIVFISPGYATSVSASASTPNMALTIDPGLVPASLVPPGKTTDQQCADELVAVINLLATESGYAELQSAPVMLVGHSAASPFVWTRSVYKSGGLLGRVFAVLPYRGFFGGAPLNGIPVLHVSSEWAENSTGYGETWEHSDGPSVRGLRKSATDSLLGEFAQSGSGHYRHAADQIGPIAAFVRSAAQLRIPASYTGTSAPTLTTITPSSGALLDPKTIGTAASTPMTYVDWTASHPGDPNALTAYWYLDQSVAQAVCDTMKAGFTKSRQLIDAVLDDGSLAPVGLANAGYASISPSVAGGSVLSDGVTFRARASFLVQSPTQRLYHGAQLGFGTSATQFFANGNGALKQVGADTFQVYVDRGAVRAQGQPWEPFLLAYNPGDANYRTADRPIFTYLPVVNTNGAAQTINFPAQANQLATNLQNVSLVSSASSGLAVQHWMVAGPYRNSSTDSSILTPDTIPAGTKFPMRVVVGAYQWGRVATGSLSAYSSAGPTFSTFWVHQNGYEAYRHATYGSLSTGSDGEQYWNMLPASTASTADPDGDGVNNLMEYAFGMDPNTGDSSVLAISGASLTKHGMPDVNVDTQPTTVNYTARFVRRRDWVNAGLTYSVQFSGDLTTWQTSTATMNVIAQDATHEAVSVPYPFFVNGRKARFFRVLVTIP